MSKPVSVREAAARSISAFVKHGKYSNLEVSSSLARYDFSDADRRLYTNLVYGVVERMPTLDYIASRLSSRPLENIDAETMACIRLGLYQLLYTDRIPPHAALSETVAAAPQKSKGFVNAVLRAFLRAGKKYEMPDKTDKYMYMSVKYSCPVPMCRFLEEKLGYEDAAKLLEKTLGEPKTYVRVNNLVTDAARLIDEVFPEGKISDIAPDMIEVPSLSGADMTDGAFFVQDAASRAAVSALAPCEGDVVVDTCASPGGKTFSAAIDMKNRGRIYSFDIHKNKVGLISKGACRLGIDIVNADCRDATKPDGSLAGAADRVICDAPCSGLGVMAKKPDIKYKDISEIERLPDVQLRVLRGAATYVKPGGVIVYSTCTVNPDENCGVVDRFLAENDEFYKVPFEVGKISSGDGAITLLPHIHDTDGFFICKMMRRS